MAKLCANASNIGTMEQECVGSGGHAHTLFFILEMVANRHMIFHVYVFPLTHIHGHTLVLQIVHVPLRGQKGVWLY